MKNRQLVHSHESAKIYRHYYKPSLNLFRLFKSVMSVLLSGSSAAAHTYYRRK
jgi:hypothetical protein